MGMYTQIRGWLNVDSIGSRRFKNLNLLLQKAKEDFKDDINLQKLERKGVCDNTIIHNGWNGSVYLFFGTELKNYGYPAEAWIKYLIKYFPNAEGKIDFQYEEDEIYCKYWLISEGKIIKEDYNDIWCKGYRNMANYIESE